MTSQPSILAWTTYKKNPNLYYCVLGPSTESKVPNIGHSRSFKFYEFTVLQVVLYVCSKILSILFPDRPNSSLTVTSECSSTISSEDDPAEMVTHLDNSRKSSKNLDPPMSPTGSSISEELLWPAPPPPIAPTESSAEKNSASPTKSSNRLSNLFSNMKIPKLKLNRKSVQGSISSSNKSSSSKSSSPNIDENDKQFSTPAKALPASKSGTDRFFEIFYNC